MGSVQLPALARVQRMEWGVQKGPRPPHRERTPPPPQMGWLSKGLGGRTLPLDSDSPCLSRCEL